MTFHLDILTGRSTLTVYVKFEGQIHRSKITVTGWKMFLFSAMDAC